jgi:toxin-antitoxin system PIN domain toxin
MPQHEASHQWLEERLSDSARVGLPWHALIAFLRIVTNPRLFRPTTSTHEAWQRVQSWLAQPSVWIPMPTDRHADVLSELLKDNVHADLVSDAHLAALAIEHGLTVCSTDGDFARFRDVRWENPLAPAGS